jgi:Txe/YoeB family toxin of Txe-Axe toxin-antitoxin module
MTDEAFAEAWEACSLGRAVSHDEHVRIARTLVRQHGTAAAEQRLVEGARRNCEAMESPERFDEDLTRRWSRRIARDVETADAKTFEGFVALHPDLLRSDLLGPPAWKRPQPG